MEKVVRGYVLCITSILNGPIRAYVHAFENALSPVHVFCEIGGIWATKAVRNEHTQGTAAQVGKSRVRISPMKIFHS